jgi:hypothetical protein
MSVTGYVSTGAFFDTGVGIARIHGEIDYNVTRSDNVVTFSNTYARIKYVRESGTWTSFYYGAGWTWRLFVDSGTLRTSDSASGTRNVNQTDQITAVAPSIAVSAGATTLSARIGAWFSGDPETFANHTLTIPGVTAASGQAITATAIKPTTATLNASVSNWGTNCTAGTGQRVEYKKASDSTWTTLAYSTSASHSRNLTGLTPNTTYDIRTYTVNGAGLTSYSTAGQFKTQSVAGVLPLLLGIIG